MCTCGWIIEILEGVISLTVDSYCRRLKRFIVTKMFQNHNPEISKNIHDKLNFQPFHEFTHLLSSLEIYLTEIINNGLTFQTITNFSNTNPL